MNNKRLPRKLKKFRRKKLAKFAEAIPKFVLESIKTAIVFSEMMSRFPTHSCVKEYIGHHMAATQKIKNDLAVVGGAISTGEFMMGRNSHVYDIPNLSKCPASEINGWSHLNADDLRKTTELLRDSFGVVQPKFINFNQ